MYIGTETNEELQQAVGSAVEVIHDLMMGKKVIAGNKEYTLLPTLTCDMKTLQQVLGMKLKCGYHV